MYRTWRTLSTFCLIKSIWSTVSFSPSITSSQSSRFYTYTTPGRGQQSVCIDSWSSYTSCCSRKNCSIWSSRNWSRAFDHQLFLHWDTRLTCTPPRDGKSSHRRNRTRNGHRGGGKDGPCWLQAFLSFRTTRRTVNRSIHDFQSVLWRVRWCKSGSFRLFSGPASSSASSC